jgi:hypothetical protein
MRDLISKWWNRKWGIWEQIDEGFSWGCFRSYVVLKRTSNDGLIQFKKTYKK